MPPHAQPDSSRICAPAAWRRALRGLMLPALLMVFLTPAPASAAGFFAAKTEWFGFRSGYGSLGLNLGFTLFNIRWNYFYFTVLDGTESGVFLDSKFRSIEKGSNQESLITFGPALGFPLHLGEGGLHELRFGARIGASFRDIRNSSRGQAVQTAMSRDTNKKFFHGGAFVPQVYYIYHVAEYFAVQAGPEIETYFNGNTPIFNFYAGFQI